MQAVTRHMLLIGKAEQSHVTAVKSRAQSLHQVILQLPYATDMMSRKSQETSEFYTWRQIPSTYVQVNPSTFPLLLLMPYGCRLNTVHLTLNVGPTCIHPRKER